MNRRPKYCFLQLILIVIGILSLASSLAYVVAPSITVIFQWIGLILPILMVLNIGVLIIWFFNRELNKIIPILSGVNMICFLPLVFQWNFKELVGSPDLRVASYNVRNMRSEYGFSTLPNIADFTESNNLDVLFLQEVPSEYTETDFLNAFVGMKSVVFSNSINLSGKRLAILSKYQLLDTLVLSTAEQSQYALFATLDYQNEKIILANCHLHTTNWNQLKGSKQSFLMGNYEVISENFKRREVQVSEIREYMDQQKFPLIVAGDFNEPPVSYSYRTIGANLKDSFREAGKGYSYTYRYLNKMFRIDYIFFNSDKFEAYNYRTADLHYSDHLPVLVDLVLRK